MDAPRFIVNVEAAVVRDGRYITIVRGPGVAFLPGALSLPGGKMEHDAGQDAIEATARREVREEVGLELGPEIVYVESHVFAAGDVQVCDVVVLGRWASGEAHPVAPAEVAAVEWLTAAEILADSRTQPWTAESVRGAEAVRLRLGW
jgi:8-oxo-dGTP diphosphatase